jgi:hypothetical protein
MNGLTCYYFFFSILQQYRSMSKRNPFVCDVYNCPYRYQWGCYCALSVKTFADEVEVALAGEHTASSHTRSSGCVLSVKQRSAVKRAVRSSPHAVGSQVHANLENLSPSKRVPFNREARKLLRAMSDISGRRLWRKWFQASSLTTQRDL